MNAVLSKIFAGYDLACTGPKGEPQESRWENHVESAAAMPGDEGYFCGPFITPSHPVHGQIITFVFRITPPAGKARKKDFAVLNYYSWDFATPPGVARNDSMGDIKQFIAQGSPWRTISRGLSAWDLPSVLLDEHTLTTIATARMTGKSWWDR